MLWGRRSVLLSTKNWEKFWSCNRWWNVLKALYPGLEPIVPSTPPSVLLPLSYWPRPDILADSRTSVNTVTYYSSTLQKLVTEFLVCRKWTEHIHRERQWLFTTVGAKCNRWWNVNPKPELEPWSLGVLIQSSNHWTTEPLRYDILTDCSHILVNQVTIVSNLLQ